MSRYRERFLSLLPDLNVFLTESHLQFYALFLSKSVTISGTFVYDACDSYTVIMLGVMTVIPDLVYLYPQHYFVGVLLSQSIITIIIIMAYLKISDNIFYLNMKLSKIFDFNCKKTIRNIRSNKNNLP